MSKRQYDIFFLVESGIGNALEVLYAVEYCLKNNRKAGIFLNRIAPSFTEYIRECYGEDVVPVSLDGIETTNLVHSFTFTDRVELKFENYYYVNADANSSHYMSETEQFLAIVKGIYPSSYRSEYLVQLKEDYSQRIKELDPEHKTVLYPGCSSDFPMKRWPYYKELIEELGHENVIVVGGNDDLKNDYSYYYPKLITTITPHIFLRRRGFHKFLRKTGLLREHAHIGAVKDEHYSFFNLFTWGELVALFRRAKCFVGNDGGISHLAGACGAKGKVIFGPSSVEKNKCYNTNMVAVSTTYGCQPCQFKVNGKDRMGSNAILCPYQLRCLYDIKPSDLMLTNNEKG
jgi:hypothetical protein